MTVLAASRIVKESDDKLWRLLRNYVSLAKEEEDYSNITSVGMDETSRSKGHDYVSTFVDMQSKRVIFVAEGKDSNTVKAFKEDLIEPQGNPKNVNQVSCDMSKAFIKGVNEYLPQAQITFDRFHIQKII